MTTLDRPKEPIIASAGGTPYNKPWLDYWRQRALAAEDALSSLPAQAVGVKALEWNETSWQNDIAIRWTSSGPFHLLIKRNIGDQWFTYDGRHFTTLDEAKAAAQADYEARILSALVAPSHPAAVGITDEMVEAAARKAGFDAAINTAAQLLSLNHRFSPEYLGMAIFQDGIKALEAALRSTP